MKIHLGVGLAGLVVISCGGGASKGASSAAATSHAPSHIALASTTPGDDKGFDVTGPAFAQYMPGAKILMVYFFDPATSPTPDCSMIGAAGMQKLKSGTMASLGLTDYPGVKTGKFPVMQSGAVSGDVAKQEMRMGGSVPDQTTLEITTYDAKTLLAAAKDPQGKSVATIDATVCPDDATPPRHMPTPEEIQAMVAAQDANPELGVGPFGSVLVIKAAGSDRSVTQGDRALAKLDPKTKTLNIYVWDEGYQPPPTCDHLAIEPEQMGSGDIAIAVIPNFPARAKGKFPVGGAEFYNFASGPSQIVSGGGAADASTIEIRQFDDNGFLAHITTDPNSKVAVSGLIQATTCPDGPIDLNSKKAKPAKPTKKKKKK